MVPLGEALEHVGEHVQKQWGNDSSIEPDLKDSIVALGELISRLASMILGELRNPGTEHKDTVTDVEHWKDLWATWWNNVNELQKTFVKAASPKSITQGGMAEEEMARIIDASFGNLS
ncbi:hypothetical protein B0H14DRAFT_2584669 [Mycena olivaceomarginata]|nr:hypothetical protein B0H14DRAFT_2584669 [Mycena olivaceomarginata]